jgi:hypothetical protein
MAAGTVPSVRETPQTKLTRWLLATVAGYDRDGWCRDLADLSEGDRRTLPVLNAIFGRDYREWLDA